jgi:hypothetical protein
MRDPTDPVIDAALADQPVNIPHHPGLLDVVTRPLMSCGKGGHAMFIRPSAQWRAARVAALAILVAACSSGPSVTTTPIVTSSPTAAPTAIPPTAVTTAAPTAAPIADGTYAGPTLQVADINALVRADKALSADQIANILYTGTTVAFTLHLRGGEYQQGQISDGGADEVGSFGTFAFPDAHTLVLEENAGLSVNTFTITFTADGFTLKRTDTSTDAEDILRTKIFWESGPFTLRP